MKPRLSVLVVVVISAALLTSLLTPLTVRAAAKTWDGGGGVDTNWHTCTNWDLDTCPVAGDDVTFDGTSTNNVTVDGDVAVASLTIGTGYTGTILQGSHAITVTGAFQQTDGVYNAGNGTGVLRVGSFTLTAGTFNLSTGRMFVNGDFINNGGTFNAATGSVMLNGTSNQTLGGSASTTFYNLTLNDGLVGYWKFDEGSGLLLTESSGYARISSDIVGATFTTTVPPTHFSNTSAISFTGNNSYAVGYLHTEEWPEAVVSNRFTYALWFKSADTAQTQTYLVNRNQPGRQTAIIYNYTPNEVEFFATLFSGTDPRPGSAMTIADTNWHHIVYAYDGTNWMGYLDGAQQFNVPRAFALDTDNRALFIGAANTGANFVNGLIDDVRIYNRALTAAEVQALANGFDPDGGASTITLGMPVQVANRLRLNSGTLDISAGNYSLAIGGNFERNGGTFMPQNGTVTFGGTGVQNITTDMLRFYNLTVGTGVTLTTSADVTVTNVLNNQQATREMKTVNGTNAVQFGLAGIVITPTVQGSLSSLDVVHLMQDHPNRTGTATHGVGWGHYWTITPNTGANGTFNATATFPHNITPDTNASVCKYTGGSGSGWDCARTSSTPNTVTRSGIGSFSDWAVGEIVGPTAVTMRSLTATAQPDGRGWLIVIAVLIAGSALIVRRARRSM